MSFKWRDLRLDDGLAAECQQLGRQPGRPFARGPSWPGPAPALGRLREPFEQELAIADDHGQEVVEVVGDASRQPADSFHFLRLKELGFEFLPCLFGSRSLRWISLTMTPTPIISSWIFTG